MLSSRIKFTPVFKWNYDAYFSKKFRVIANEGGSRASKTYSVCQLLIYIANNFHKEISIVGVSLPHLKRGARKDFLKIMKEMGIYSERRFNRTDNIYHFPGGGYIEFFGADNVGKVHGPGRDILFCNEANLIHHDVFYQLRLRTKEQIFIDYNPIESSHWVYDQADNPRNIKFRSYYKNNIKNLSKEQILDIEGLKDVDPLWYKVYTLGLRGYSKAIIYSNWEIITEMPTGVGSESAGMDFGDVNPTCLIDTKLYEGAYYVDELIYSTEVETSDCINYMNNLNYSRSKRIWCDHSKPRIEELCKADYNAMKADKDVEAGISHMKAHKIYITQRSLNVLREIKKYKRKENINGEVLKDIVKKDDHAMDGMRYGAYSEYMADQEKPTENLTPGRRKFRKK